MANEKRIIHVLGYCRSTVGGYDVWTPDGDLVLSLRAVPATSINRMNYRAVLDYLLHLGAAGDMEMRIGCYTVAGQLDGSIPANRPHIREMVRLIRAAIPATASVRFVYDREASPPRV